MGCTCILLVIVVLVLITDILMALCIRAILPRHVKDPGYYPADGRTVPYEEAVQICPCLAGIFLNGTDNVTFNPVPTRGSSINLTRYTLSTTKKKRIVNTTTTPIPPKARRSVMDREKYQFLVAITSQNGSSEENEFICNGIITGWDTFITAENCITTNSINLAVVCDSKEHYLDSYTYDQATRLTTVKVFPPFPGYIRIPKMKTNGKWTKATLLTWNRRVSDIDSQEFTQNPCGKPEKITLNPSCGNMSSNFLLSDRNEVLGVKMLGCDEFYGFTMENEMESYNIYENDCSLKIIE